MLSPNQGPSKIGLRKAAAEAPPRKPGIAPKSKFERNIRPGQFLFMEGDSGTEMYIIKQGKIKILKQEGTKMVELVTLGPGAVLGEMSLLDNAPRSASAKAVTDLKVTVIDQNHLALTLSKVPAWLNSIIKIVVQRLRETTERNYQDILRNGVVAVLRYIMHYAQDNPNSEGLTHFMLTDKIKEGAYSIFGLSNADAIKILKYLEFLKIGSLHKNKTGTEFIKFEDIQIIELFYGFLKTQAMGKKPLVDQVSTSACELAKILVDAGETRGVRRDDRISVDLKQVRIHMEQLYMNPEQLDEDLLKELKKAGLIELQQRQTSTKQASYNKEMVSWISSGLPVLVKQHQWREAFSQDINKADF